jgi:hypothetical protein
MGGSMVLWVQSNGNEVRENEKKATTLEGGKKSADSIEQRIEVKQFGNK